MIPMVWTTTLTKFQMLNKTDCDTMAGEDRATSLGESPRCEKRDMLDATSGQ